MTKYLFVCLMLVGSCFAQFGAGAATTVVSATVTDANGTPYSFGSYAASFTGFAGNTPNPPTSLSGAQLFKVPFSQASTSAQTGKLDQNGSFTVTLLDNSQIIPANTQWSFTICALDGFTCFVSNQTISGATQSLTTALSAAATPWYHSTLKSLKMGAGGIVFNDGTHQTTAAGGVSPAGSQFDIQTKASSSALGNVTAPSANGKYVVGYNVIGATPVAATALLTGIQPRAITGAATTDTILYSDNLNTVNHDKAASGTIAETLPTAIVLGNANLAFKYCNHSAQTDTITPTTWTIQAGSSAAASSLNVAPGVCYVITVDPNSSTNWLADGNSAGSSGVSAWSGDGTLFDNSSSNGAVTAHQKTFAADTVYGNPTASTATPVATTNPVVNSLGTGTTPPTAINAGHGFVGAETSAAFWTLAAGLDGYWMNSTLLCMDIVQGAKDLGCAQGGAQSLQIITSDWTCGTAGTASSCVTAQTIGTLTFAFPLIAKTWSFDCNLIVGQATGATANNWDIQTATNGATNIAAAWQMNTAAAVVASGALTGTASTTSSTDIGGTWTLGATGTKMPVHIWGTIEATSASGTVFNLQLKAPTVGDLVTIYRGSQCRVF